MNILYFFTFWNVLLIIVHKYTYKYINLLYISFITLILGLYLSFINPRIFIVDIGNTKYVYKDLALIIPDIIHILIFLFIFYKYNTFYNKKDEDQVLLISIFLLLFYILFVDIKKVYGISLLELLIVFCIANMIYFILF